MLARIALLVLLAACGGSQKAKVVVSDTVVELVKPVEFTGEAELTPDAQKALDEVAESLVRNQDIRLVEVQAFVVDGDEATREQIAHKRAQVARDYLLGKQVEPERLEAQGYAKLPPDDRQYNQVRFLVLKRAPTR